MSVSTATGLFGTLDRAKSAYFLRHASRVGQRVSVLGRPFIANSGTFEVGDGTLLSSSPVQSHFVVGSGGVLSLGKNVTVSYGAAISAEREIRVGDDTRIGPFVVIMDSDFHQVGDRNAHAQPQPVKIGRGVVIESRVTILRGSTLGDGVRVRSGSVVSGNVPAGSVVGGVPARPIDDDASASGNGGNVDVAELLQKVLGLAEKPKPSDGPDQIPEWDSLGALKILLAIEKSYGITVREDQLKAASSVSQLDQIVRAALGVSGTQLDLAQLLQKTLGLAEKPKPSDGPDQIPEWDSLGALKILLAIEKTYGISVREDQLKAAQSVVRLEEIVRTALG